jgi:hypothetical protein
MSVRKSFICPLMVTAMFAVCVCGSRSAQAQRAPVIVVPGRAGVPVMLWGQDVSGAVIEGEFGLDRPGHMPITVTPPVGPFYAGVPPEPPPGGYYPTTGTRPRVGRQEVQPPPDRPPPRPAESFSRSWSTESPNLPATIPPENPPPVIVAPQIYQQQQPWPPQSGPGPQPLPRRP